MKKVLSLFLLLFCICSLSAKESPVLQASIAMAPAWPPNSQKDTMQPGMPALLRTMIKNVGTIANREGEIFIRFTLPKALAKIAKGLSFETEKEPLPHLQPGELREIFFKTPQPLPDIVEFLKNDWAKHLYEAVVRFGGEEFVIGSGTITYSAHYYLGPGVLLPTAVPE